MLGKRLASFLRSSQWPLIFVPIVFITISILLMLRTHEEFVFYEDPNPKFPRQVWAIYITKFGNPDNGDSGYFGWQEMKEEDPSQVLNPPFHIDSPLYPELGPYSSHDKSVLRQHMKYASEANLTGLIFQWWGLPNLTNDAKFAAETFELALEIAQEFDIKIGLQIMNYFTRNNNTLFQDFGYIAEKYQNHQSYLRVNQRALIDIQSPWEIDNLYLVIKNHRRNSFKPYLITHAKSHRDISLGMEHYFDAVYSSPLDEYHLYAKDSYERGLRFIALITPGSKTQDHDNGKLYSKQFLLINSNETDAIIIDSFNNWQSGSVIEPAKEIGQYQFTSSNWASNSSGSYYLRLTSSLIVENFN